MGTPKNKEDFKTWVKLNTETKEERTARMKEWWMTLKPFKTPQDVPTLPRVDEKENWENKPGFYVIWSSERILDAGEKLLLEKKGREMSVLPHDQ